MMPDANTRCVSCGGVWHSASGDWDARFDVATCGRCHRAFRDWFKGHAKREWLVRAPATSADVAAKRKGRVIARLSFYEAAATSIRAA
jgi:hypothetical protein